MIRLVVRSGEPGDRWGRYRLAGRTVEVCPPLAEIEAFSASTAPLGASDGAPGDRFPGPGEPPEAADGEAVYRGPVWIGGAEREAACCRSPAGYRLDIEGVGRVEVAPDGSCGLVEVASTAGDGRSGGVTPVMASLPAETALGPALVLALALGGTFCLHAAAVALPSGSGVGEGVVAFLGATGAGKSTLARLLDGARPGWLRVADDVLPVVWSEEGPRACPRFPQLKVPEGSQPGARVAESLPLVALYLLGGPAGGAGRADAPIACRRLSGKEAVLALVRNTVAARLFDGALLDEHLDLCTALGERPGVVELGYPWRGALVPGLAEAVASGPEVA